MLPILNRSMLPLRIRPDTQERLKAGAGLGACHLEEGALALQELRPVGVRKFTRPRGGGAGAHCNRPVSVLVCQQGECRCRHLPRAAAVYVNNYTCANAQKHCSPALAVATHFIVSLTLFRASPPCALRIRQRLEQQSGAPLGGQMRLLLQLERSPGAAARPGDEP